MKVKAFLFASLFAMSLSLTACGGNAEETPATMDTTNGATTSPETSAPVIDSASHSSTPSAMPTDSAANATGTTATGDTAAAGADSAK